MIQSLKNLVGKTLAGLCLLIFLSLVLSVLWGVATRYLLGQQAHWTEELARLLLVWLAMAGAALAYLDHSHLGVDILTRQLDPGARRIADLVTHFCVFAFASAVMLYGGSALFLERWDSGQVMSALPIRKAWFYLSLPVSGTVIALFAFDLFLGTCLGRSPVPTPTAVEVE